MGVLPLVVQDDVKKETVSQRKTDSSEFVEGGVGTLDLPAHHVDLRVCKKRNADSTNAVRPVEEGLRGQRGVELREPDSFEEGGIDEQALKRILESRTKNKVDFSRYAHGTP